MNITITVYSFLIALPVLIALDKNQITIALVRFSIICILMFLFSFITNFDQAYIKFIGLISSAIAWFLIRTRIKGALTDHPNNRGVR